MQAVGVWVLDFHMTTALDRLHGVYFGCVPYGALEQVG
jgi:hypothetical protein